MGARDWRLEATWGVGPEVENRVGKLGRKIGSGVFFGGGGRPGLEIAPDPILKRRRGASYGARIDRWMAQAQARATASRTVPTTGSPNSQRPIPKSDA